MRVAIVTILAVGIGVLNWWLLYSAFIRPSTATIGRLFVVAILSGAVVGGKIGWDIYDLWNHEARQ